MKIDKSIAYTVLAGVIVAGGVIGANVYHQYNDKQVHAQSEQMVVTDSTKLNELHKKFNTSDLNKANSQLVKMQSIVTNKSTKHDKQLLNNDKASFIKAIEKAQSDLKSKKFDFNKIDDASKQFDDFAKQVASFKSLDKTELEGFKKTIQDDKKSVIDNLNKQKQEQDNNNENQGQQDSEASEVESKATQEASQADIAASQTTQSNESAYAEPASSYSAPASSYSSSYSAPASSYSAPSYSAPASSYSAPSYSAPASSYSAPASSYSAPAQSAPASNLPSNYDHNTVYYGQNGNGGYNAYDSNGDATATIG